MDVALIVLCLLGWAVALFLVLVLMKMAGDQDHAARRAEKGIELKPRAQVKDAFGAGSGDRVRRSSDGPTPE